MNFSMSTAQLKHVARASWHNDMSDIDAPDDIHTVSK